MPGAEFRLSSGRFSAQTRQTNMNSARKMNSRFLLRCRRGGVPSMVFSLAGCLSRRGIEATSAFVYGCCGHLKISSTVAVFDDSSGIHHGNTVGKLRNHAQIVRDDDDRHSEFFFEFAQKIRESAPESSRRARSSAHRQSKLRLTGNRHRNHHALAHSAGKFVRIIVDSLSRIIDADVMQK